MNNCKVIVMLVIGAVLTGVYFFNENKEKTLRVYKEELMLLKAQNDTLLWKNKKLDKRHEGLKIKQDSLKALLVSKTKRINELKQLKYEKINAIEHYTNDELYLFFSKLAPRGREFNTDSTRAE
jgi:DnaJ-domain-containing protein 1